MTSLVSVQCRRRADGGQARPVSSGAINAPHRSVYSAAGGIIARFFCSRGRLVYFPLFPFFVAAFFGCFCLSPQQRGPRRSRHRVVPRLFTPAFFSSPAAFGGDSRVALRPFGPAGRFSWHLGCQGRRRPPPHDDSTCFPPVTAVNDRRLLCLALRTASVSRDGFAEGNVVKCRGLGPSRRGANLRVAVMSFPCRGLARPRQPLHVSGSNRAVRRAAVVAWRRWRCSLPAGGMAGTLHRRAPEGTPRHHQGRRDAILGHPLDAASLPRCRTTTPRAASVTPRSTSATTSQGHHPPHLIRGACRCDAGRRMSTRGAPRASALRDAGQVVAVVRRRCSSGHCSGERGPS